MPEVAHIYRIVAPVNTYVARTIELFKHIVNIECAWGALVSYQAKPFVTICVTKKIDSKQSHLKGYWHGDKLIFKLMPNS